MPSARFAKRRGMSMKQRMWAGMVAAIAVAATLAARADDKKLVYADFEEAGNGRAVSARGGAIDLWSYEEDKTHKSSYKGAPGVDPPTPELVRIKADDPNHLAKFDYLLQAPNQYAGVAMEIHGLPDANGSAQSEDVSGYKYLSLQAYATGIRIVRLEMRTSESGKDTRAAYPQYTLEVKPSLNTYRVPLSGFVQPGWVPNETRMDPKDVLKKLSSIALIAFCDQCQQPQKGMVIVDNVAFEK
jgi:hypothetical protein